MAPQVTAYPNALRACIKQAGYSFREVSQETGIPERTLYDWAAGHRVIPHNDREVLARLLGCPIEALAPNSHLLHLLVMKHQMCYNLTMRTLRHKCSEETI